MNLATSIWFERFKSICAGASYKLGNVAATESVEGHVLDAVPATAPRFGKVQLLTGRNAFIASEPRTISFPSQRPIRTMESLSSHRG